MGKPSNHPATLDEAVDAIIASLNDDDKKQLLAIPASDLIRYHHGWGTGIRNELGLWGINGALLADCGSANMEADDASMVVMQAVWNKLHGQPVDDARIKNYRSLSEKMCEAGPEEVYRQFRFRSSGQREKTQNIYRLMSNFFKMDFGEFKDLAARVDAEDDVSTGQTPDA